MEFMSFLLPLRRLLPLLSALLLAGCQSAAYYTQAVRGQAALVLAREPIERLLARPDTAPDLRQRLQRVQRIRAFAATGLGLPVRGQYDSYVELGRPYPVWALSAAPALSLEPRRWCYWFVGCLSYRGYFREAAARREAARLQAQGYEVDLGGVSAYSTLGWFSDPVLSSFVTLPEEDMAELIFHELTHQALYVPGDTVFNESLAVAVAEEGVRRYARREGLDLTTFDQARLRQREFVALVLEHRRRLENALAAANTPAQKRAAKDGVYAALRDAYVARRQAWGGYAGYDAWMEGLNNARFNSVATYYDLVPGFRALLQASGGDLPTFLARCRDLARLDITERHLRLVSSVAGAAEAAPGSGTECLRPLCKEAGF